MMYGWKAHPGYILPICLNDITQSVSLSLSHTHTHIPLTASPADDRSRLDPTTRARLLLEGICEVPDCQPVAVLCYVVVYTFLSFFVVFLFDGCFSIPQRASVSQGRICSDCCMCCHTETEVADPTSILTLGQPVPALILSTLAPYSVATGEPVFKSLVSLLLGKKGATRGVTVSISAFLACHQCYCAGSSLAWDLSLSCCSMWHFLKLVARGFLRVLRFPPLLHRLMVQPTK